MCSDDDFSSSDEGFFYRIIKVLIDIEPEMTRDEYNKFAGEVKISVCVLTKVASIVEKINNWTYNAVSAGNKGTLTYLISLIS